MSEQPTREEWIEIHKQERVAAGTSLAEQEMLQALAEVVLIDRLGRALLGPGDEKKGRCTFIWTGEPTEAEQMWSAMQAKHKKTRVVKGGPLIGQEF